MALLEASLQEPLEVPCTVCGEDDYADSKKK